jgi:glutamate dehydrogenase/leucine dehydrogenase
VDLEAVVVIDNIAAGASIGGVRMAPDVTLGECVKLARAMTLKNAAAGLPHGGGKSVIRADPAMPAERKLRTMRAFAQAVKDLKDYIPGPDMGTNETCMAWVWDEIGRAVGLPRALGGIPLDEIGATGHGLVSALEAAENVSGVGIKGSRVSVQGFGAVGKHAARLLCEKGATIIAASDSSGTVFHPGGLDLDAMTLCKAEGRKLSSLLGKGIEHGPPDASIVCECDILIPAARPDAITCRNVDQIKARIIAQGANIPATLDAEKILHERGVWVIPDFIANAGGVICASVEYHGGSESQALIRIDEKIRQNVNETLALALEENLLPREAATRMARTRVLEAASLRRFG